MSNRKKRRKLRIELHEKNKLPKKFEKENNKLKKKLKLKKKFDFAMLESQCNY